MVTLTARQSIILKCSMKASVLLGNYEFYYAAGLFCGINHMEVDEDILPGALYKWIAPKLKEFSGAGNADTFAAKKYGESVFDRRADLCRWAGYLTVLRQPWTG